MKRPQRPRRYNGDENTFQLETMNLLRLGLPAEAFAFHVPNQGKRSPVTGALFKALGMRPGMTDIVLVCAMNGTAHVAFLELKNPNGGDLSVDQKQFRDHCGQFGIPWACCDNLPAVAKFVGDWLRHIGGSPFRAVVQA